MEETRRKETEQKEAETEKAEAQKTASPKAKPNRTKTRKTGSSKAGAKEAVSEKAETKETDSPKAKPNRTKNRKAGSNKAEAKEVETPKEETPKAKAKKEKPQKVKSQKAASKEEEIDKAESKKTDSPKEESSKAKAKKEKTQKANPQKVKPQKPASKEEGINKAESQKEDSPKIDSPKGNPKETGSQKAGSKKKKTGKAGRKETAAQRKQSDPKEMICELVQEEQYVPMKEKELANLLQVPREERGELKRLLEELLTEGILTVDGRGRYQKADGNFLVGTFISNARGFGFVEVEGREEDLFVPEEHTGGAFHKDTVQVVLLPPRHGKRMRQEAKVVRILERGFVQIVGTYEQTRERYGFVTPDLSKIARDIFIPQEHSQGAVSGHKVVVEITDYGGERRNPEGRVIEILGHENDPGVDILSIVRGYELPMEFDERVLEQVERVACPVSEAEREGRRDLRDVPMVTIDGEDSNDLDDAVSVSKEILENGECLYHLGVHIADVTHYVRERSALDREALKRGTSVYLVDRVIPMLPHALSNGICSLNAGEERLALSCLMTIDKKGEIVDHEIAETLICVDQRMTYTAVAEILEDENAVKRRREYRKYAPLVPMFRQMEELASLLRKKRKKRGSIDFDFPECKILLDAQGHPTEIRAYERNVATDMIEDFMLAANETVAQHFYWLETPFVYRVHDVPDPENIEKLSAFIRNFGYHMKALGRRESRTGGEEVHPKEIQKLLAKVAGTPEEPMISRLALRSMKQARYSASCTGHFGLACPYYCHFTSPIRRYPDLQIHRIIKEQLRGRMSGKRIEHYREILPEVAKRSSELERRADEAERETDKLKKVEYMEGHLGEEYEGVVSGVTRWGVYVELPNTVEGLIHVTKLPGYDHYLFHEDTGELTGVSTGQTYRLGMPLRVKVSACDRALRTIDFDLAEEKEEEEEVKRAWRKRKKRKS